MYLRHLMWYGAFFRNLQCDRNTIHKNLVLTLCLAEIIFLAGIAQYDRPVRGFRSSHREGANAQRLAVAVSSNSSHEFLDCVRFGSLLTHCSEFGTEACRLYLQVLCTLIAVALHYLFLASFAWMCLEGVQLYVMLIEVFEVEKSRVRLYYLAAYGVPALIVCISAAVNHRGYGTPD